MKLGNPPVIEAWIEFNFSRVEEAKSWNENAADDFIEHYFSEKFPKDKRQLLYEKRLRFTNVNGSPEYGGSEDHFEKMKAFSNDEDRCIQANGESLVFNVIKKDNEWPEYPNYRDEALNVFEKYIESQSSSLNGIQSLAFHYRDIVHVPLKDRKVELKEYLTIYPEISGDYHEFGMNLRMAPNDNDDILHLIIQALPPLDESERKSIRIRMDWHLSSPFISVLQKSVVSKWLDNAHVAIDENFKSAFTEKGWDLFSPEE